MPAVKLNPQIKLRAAVVDRSDGKLWTEATESCGPQLMIKLWTAAEDKAMDRNYGKLWTAAKDKAVDLNCGKLRISLFFLPFTPFLNIVIQQLASN